MSFVYVDGQSAMGQDARISQTMQNEQNQHSRKATQRRTIDYTANALIAIERDAHEKYSAFNPVKDQAQTKPTTGAMLDFLPSHCYRGVDKGSSFALKFVHVSANKIKTPINKGSFFGMESFRSCSRFLGDVMMLVMMMVEFVDFRLFMDCNLL